MATAGTEKILLVHPGKNAQMTRSESVNVLVKSPFKEKSVEDYSVVNDIPILGIILCIFGISSIQNTRSCTTSITIAHLLLHSFHKILCPLCDNVMTVSDYYNCFAIICVRIIIHTPFITRLLNCTSMRASISFLSNGFVI